MPRRSWAVPAVVLCAVAAAGAVGVAHAGEELAEGRGVGHGFHSGDVPIVTTRRGDGSYEMVDPTRGGIRVTDHGRDSTYEDSGTVPTDPDNEWGNGRADDAVTGAVDAYYAAARTWDYFRRAHDRTGVAGDGIGPRLVTGFGDPSTEDDRSASWRPACRCILISPAPPGGRTMSTLDIVGHEIGHGIDGSTAGLGSGGGAPEALALAEANGDIIGTLVEFDAHNPNDPPDYTIGEGAVDRPVRFMADPTQDGQSPGCWRPGIAGDGTSDPHEAAGIVDKFFYQLAVGSGKSSWGDSPTCGGAPAVHGIGNDRAGRIWYTALQRHLVANSNFSGARRATVKAAAELYGAGGAEVAAVEAAWLAVGVDGTDEVPDQPRAPKLARIDPWAAKVGRPTELFLNAPDPQRQKVTYTATGLPAGLTLDPATGVISGTPTTTGEYRPTFTVEDTDGNRDTVTLDRRSEWVVQ